MKPASVVLLDDVSGPRTRRTGIDVSFDGRLRLRSAGVAAFVAVVAVGAHGPRVEGGRVMSGLGSPRVVSANQPANPTPPCGSSGGPPSCLVKT